MLCKSLENKILLVVYDFPNLDSLVMIGFGGEILTFLLVFTLLIGLFVDSYPLGETVCLFAEVRLVLCKQLR